MKPRTSPPWPSPRQSLGLRRILFVITLICLTLLHTLLSYPFRTIRTNDKANSRLESRCKYLRTPAGPPSSFHTRTHSDRFVANTKPVLLRNAKIWTARVNGTEVIYGDILLDKGLVKGVGHIPRKNLVGLQSVDLNGAWITPGLVDLHSHIGVSSMPGLNGARDGNSHQMPILPFLRSIDGLNTHDESYQLAVSGGVTTAQILPGSANNIGGQAFVIKLRPTAERSTFSKVVEPPVTLNRSILDADFDFSVTPRWRHMKHACGENPDRLYGQSRLDAAWNFRHAYNEARKVKQAQDDFCEKIERGQPLEAKDFPESPLELESLVDVLRGRVKLSIHCYEAVDLDMIIRLSNEFQFPVASFHHAGETYLVPELLKTAWGGAPAIALFAANFRKKREAFRGSEFAPRILADQGLSVVMKSDHPVLNSRYLLYEAQLAHYYGLDVSTALMSVTSTPATAAGLGHRVGMISEGYDADIVVWDSHPLSLGATPKQVYIDGIAQLAKPHVLSKTRELQDPPSPPDFAKEAADAIKYDGLPPLEGKRLIHSGTVQFARVGSAYVQDGGKVRALFDSHATVGQTHGGKTNWTVFVRDGEITCYSLSTTADTCGFLRDSAESTGIVIDLDGGSLAPGLTSFGSPLGLVEIRLEPSTNDGNVYDPLHHDLPALLGDSDTAVVSARDGLQFAGRNSLLAYRGGVTQAVTMPTGSGFLRGVSASFSTGARHALEPGAIIQGEIALHVILNRRMLASVSTQVAALRRLLIASRVPKQSPWTKVREGLLPLVVHVDSADIMATLLELKNEFEMTSGHQLLLTFAGATEAHLLAAEISRSNSSVILTSSRSFPWDWDTRRILPGAPLTMNTSLSTLLAHNVNVAVGVVNEADARHARFDLAWAYLESNGVIDKSKAISLASTDLERALGFHNPRPDLVAYKGGDMFSMESKVVAVVSRRRKVIDMF